MKKDFLRKIVEDKKREVAVAKQLMPESRLREKAFVPRKRRPFFKKLHVLGPFGVNIIAEIKRASPSKGDIRPDLDPAVYAAAYETGRCRRAVCSYRWTPLQGGSPRPDDRPNHHVTSGSSKRLSDFRLPDFRVRNDGGRRGSFDRPHPFSQQLKDYLRLCDELALDALVEIHSESDIEKASLAGARLIGINNRNLKSFETDIETAVRMTSLLDKDQVAVAASGIRSRKDIDLIIDSGIWNFLIGESLVRAEHPKEFLESLHRI